MSLSVSKFTRMLDGTLTNACATKSQLDELLKTAKQYHYYSVLGPRCFNSYVVKALEGTDTIPGSGCCVATGNDPTEVKAFHAKYAVSEGIKEIDMIMNMTYFKSGLKDLVVKDIKAVRDAISKDIPLKCILEVCFLSDKEIREACELLIEGGVDYIKTATGTQGPTTLHHIDVITSTVKGRVKIKAAGGIRTVETIEKMINLGVDRFGISHKNALNIIQELQQR